MFEDLNEVDRKEMTELLKQSGDANKDIAIAAQIAVAAALTTPIRQGILSGDNITGIFAPEKFEPGSRVEYPVDFYRPDNASEFAAYTIPNQGKIPQRQIEGDVISVPTYDVGSSIDWLLRYAKEARWDIVSRAMQVMEAGVVEKLNNDGWHTILSGAFDRNLVVSDANAAAGQFTKRLVSLMKLVMRRNGGGNSGSLNRSRLTHLYVSPEALEDVRNWGVDQVDEITRREIFLANDEGATQIYNVKIMALDELGEGQKYQTYYQNVIAAGAANNGMAASDVELVVGLDLANANDSFVMPIREEFQVFADDSLHRSRRQGLYCWGSLGYGLLNNSKVILGSL